MATKLNVANRKMRIPTKAAVAAPAPVVVPKVVAKPVMPVAPPQATERVGAASRQVRVSHDVQTMYDGPSPGFVSHRSTTPWKHHMYEKQPDRSLTPRTLQTLQPLKEKYGASPWKRGNLDTGVANAAIAKGFIQPLSGDGKSEDDTYRFTQPALETKFI